MKRLLSQSAPLLFTLCILGWVFPTHGAVPHHGSLVLLTRFEFIESIGKAKLESFRLCQFNSIFTIVSSFITLQMPSGKKGGTIDKLISI